MRCCKARRVPCPCSAGWRSCAARVASCSILLRRSATRRRLREPAQRYLEKWSASARLQGHDLVSVRAVAAGGTDCGPLAGSLSNDLPIEDGLVVNQRLSLLVNSSEPGHELLVAGLDTAATVGLLAVALFARVPLLAVPAAGWGWVTIRQFRRWPDRDPDRSALATEVRSSSVTLIGVTAGHRRAER